MFGYSGKISLKKIKFCHWTVWNENKSLRLGFDFNRRWCVIFAIFRRHYTSTSKISNLSHWIRQKYSKIANCSLFYFLEKISCRPKCQSQWKSIGFFCSNWFNRDLFMLKITSEHFHFGRTAKFNRIWTRIFLRFWCEFHRFFIFWIVNSSKY